MSIEGRIVKHDPVNHPAHYTSHPSGVECIEVTRHMTFNRGNAIKYIWRAGEKGDAIEDLRKAKFYVEDEIKRLEGAATSVPGAEKRLEALASLEAAGWRERK